MKFSTTTSAAARARAGVALVPVLGGRLCGSAAQAIDEANGGRLSRLLASGDLGKKAAATLSTHLDGSIARVVLASFGKDKEANEKSYIDTVRAAYKAAGSFSADDALSLLHDVPVAGRDLAWKVRVQALAGRDIAYRFEQMKSEPDPKPPRPKRVALALERADAAAAGREIDRASAIANGMDLAKDLGNLPANVCTPTYLADTARKLAREFGLKCEVLDEKQMQALKMGALLAVARGSAQPPKLIVLRYQGAGAKQAPIVLVGKGITFDTGGISLKPAPEMDEMKFDMCGAASVLGTMRAVAEAKAKVNLVVVVPTTENMPGGRATRPGDIVTTMSGKTVEILNTDAEGRLILCDALEYAKRFSPAAVVDVANLTGACVIALGHHHSGLFSPNDELAGELQAAGREVADTCWRMPLDDAYQEQLKSPFADVANIGGRPAGSVTAACFLSRFTKDYTWAHLDIAGTAWRSGTNKGASGRPVPLLTRFVLARSGAA
ncbi:MAG: leucyl aminopeptidase [Burkholderiaceae bacterium]|nr:leucyl aminopeptidase [Burkholderiaceae bacterium]